MSNNVYKQFIESNTEILAKFTAYATELEMRKSLTMASEKGQQVKILNGKNKGFTGVVEFIGYTRFDRAGGSKEKSVCIKQGETKVWTKQHNTEKLAA